MARARRVVRLAPAPASSVPTSKELTIRIDVAQPAAGQVAIVSAAQLGNERLTVVSCRAVLTTSATVANRFFSLQYRDSSGVVQDESAAAVFATASGTQTYEGQIGRSVGEWNTAGTDLTPALFPLSQLVLEAGSTVRFNVVNMQAADQLSGLFLFVLEVR